MSHSHLEAFLARIYVDERARAKFLADPRGEATKAGLTAQEVEDVIKIDRDGLELFAQSLERKKQKAGALPPS
ncbi:MAG TPA: hypothetical protein VFM63_09470 [Pyrinomonadaceae bacterium]|nr:hypothetical protein [Pyrinomonadaceae bacterium]